MAGETMLRDLAPGVRARVGCAAVEIARDGAAFIWLGAAYVADESRFPRDTWDIAVWRDDEAPERFCVGLRATNFPARPIQWGNVPRGDWERGREWARVSKVYQHARWLPLARAGGQMRDAAQDGATRYLPVILDRVPRVFNVIGTVAILTDGEGGYVAVDRIGLDRFGNLCVDPDAALSWDADAAAGMAWVESRGGDGLEITCWGAAARWFAEREEADGWVLAARAIEGSAGAVTPPDKRAWAWTTYIRAAGVARADDARGPDVRGEVDRRAARDGDGDGAWALIDDAPQAAPATGDEREGLIDGYCLVKKLRVGCYGYATVYAVVADAAGQAWVNGGALVFDQPSESDDVGWVEVRRQVEGYAVDMRLVPLARLGAVDVASQNAEDERRGLPGRWRPAYRIVSYGSDPRDTQAANSPATPLTNTTPRGSIGVSRGGRAWAQPRGDAGREGDMATAATTDTKREAPEWLRDYRRSFTAGEAHAFLLHGDVDGMAYESVAHWRLLLVTLAAKRNVVIVYDIVNGISIYDETGEITVGASRAKKTRRARAVELLGPGAQPQQNQQQSQLASAIAAFGPGQQASNDPFAAARPIDALRIIGRLLRAGNPKDGGEVAVVINYADTLIPAGGIGDKSAMSPDDRAVLVTLLTWAKDLTISKLGNPVFIVARDMEQIHSDLRHADSGVKAIKIRLPDQAARRDFINWYMAYRKDQGKPIGLADLDEDELANLTAGLSLRNIEDVLLLAAQEGGVTRAIVKVHKDMIIQTSYSEVAEMIDPLPNGFADIGGMESVKAWARDTVIAPIRSGNRDDAPKAILLVGPPGTGKTVWVLGLAREIGFAGVKLNAAKILGGIVGESERKLQKFFDLCRSLAPVLVFVDELDQGDMARRGTNSGNPVAANLFNAMLQFMGDESLRGRVLMVFASNRPDLIDSAMLRFGRMDAIVPILLGDAEERDAVIRVLARQQRLNIADHLIDQAVRGTERYSNADLGAIVRKTRLLAQRDGGRAEATEQDVAKALRMIRPSSSQAAWYELLAVNACNDAEFLPENYAALLQDRDALREKIAASSGDAARDGAASARGGRDW